MYHFSLFSMLYSINTIFIVLLLSFFWKRRKRTGIIYLFFMEVCILLWSLTIAFEAAATTVPLKALWSALSYLPLSASPIFMMLFAIEFNLHHNIRIKKRYLSLLFLVPTFITIAAFTNASHGLLWPKIVIQVKNNLAIYHQGPLFWVNVIHVYLALASAILLIARGIFRLPKFYLPQILILTSAIILTMTGNLMYILRVNPIQGFDWTPICLGISGLLFYHGNASYHLFNLMPIAHSKIIEAMEEGILVLDPENRIADSNPASRLLLHKSEKELMGRSIDSLGTQWEQFSELTASIPVEISLSQGNITEVNPTALYNRHNRYLGKLLLFRDITARKQAENELIEMATIDGLTGIYNRRYFMELATREVERSIRYKKELSIAMIDIDHFKKINDTFGHDVGDTIITMVTSTLQQSLRKVDIIGRIGGEEFALVLPETNQKVAFKFLDRIRSKISDLSQKTPQGECSCTISIGLTGKTVNSKDLSEILKKADKALYLAKQNGRNQIRMNEQ